MVMSLLVVLRTTFIVWEEQHVLVDLVVQSLLSLSKYSTVDPRINALEAYLVFLFLHGRLFEGVNCRIYDTLESF